MPLLLILGLGGAVCGWSFLLIFSGERQRRLSDALAAGAPLQAGAKANVKSNKN